MFVGILLERQSELGHVVRTLQSRKSALVGSILCHPGGGKLHTMGQLVAKESTGTAVIGRTRSWTRSELSSEKLLADINAVRNCKVAEQTVVRIIRWTMVMVL